ncbi:MAG: formylglycine-generating enzyme family protein [Nitrospira sp.]|nr:formylglycine-generating enzyme family protein [Nitrospira sp.]
MKNNKVKNQGLTPIVIVLLFFAGISFAEVPAQGVKSVQKETAVSDLPGMDGMVLVKGGCFDMGDVTGDGDPDEVPVHKVCVDDFYIGKYEVTQKQWKAVMGKNPSSYFYCGGACPVENISYIEVQEFIKRVNRITNGNYRLPTEAEWEFAARSSGKKEEWAGQTTEKELEDYAWFKNNSGFNTHPVGQKKPNGLGLYDMCGNVQEWVNDFYDGDYYATRPKKGADKNPPGPEWSQYRVVRGGAFLNGPWGIRTMLRFRFTPDDRGREFGFRLAAPGK